MACMFGTPKDSEARQAGLTGFVWLTWFGWLLCFIRLVWFNQTNKMNQTGETDPITVFLR